MKFRFSVGTVAFLLCATTKAPAQPGSRVGGGIAIGGTANLAEGFSNDQICPKRSAVSASARATFALTRIIQLEAMGEVFAGPQSDCVDGLIPPPPPSGPYTRTIDYYNQRITDPPTVLSIRAGGSLSNAGRITVRPYIGIARFAGKRITTPQIGLTILEGRRQTRLLFEIEGWWYSVPEEQLDEEFLDGQLINRTVTEHGVRTFTAIFRLGFTSRVGR